MGGAFSFGRTLYLSKNNSPKVVFGKYNSPDLRSVMKNCLVERSFEIADPRQIRGVLEKNLRHVHSTR
jgi:hypothetical protein